MEIKCRIARIEVDYSSRNLIYRKSYINSLVGGGGLFISSMQKGGGRGGGLGSLIGRGAY